MKRGRKSSRFCGRQGGEKRRCARRVRSGTLSFRKRRAPTRRPAKSSRPRRNDDKKTTESFARHVPNAPFATDDGKFARRRKKRFPSPTVRQDFKPAVAPRKRSTDFNADGRTKNRILADLAQRDAPFLASGRRQIQADVLENVLRTRGVQTPTLERSNFERFQRRVGPTRPSADVLRIVSNYVKRQSGPQIDRLVKRANENRKKTIERRRITRLRRRFFCDFLRG